jgi:glycosyltransferase involved in cell wall biosynthesis
MNATVSVSPGPGPDYSVVVPVFDEGGAAPALAREIAAAFAGENHEIIFIDDASRDDTKALLTALKAEIPQLRVLSHRKNSGQSRAVRSGVLAARAPIVVTLDGDGQNDPADAPRLARALRAAPAELALVGGERVKRQDSSAKRFASKFGNGVRKRLLRDTANDTGCGLKAFRRDLFLALPYFDGLHRFLPALVRREGFDIGYVDVVDRPRRAGTSNYGFWDRLWIGILDLMGVWWLIRRRHRVPQVLEVKRNAD